ncbi:VOC family protein [Novosphingobium sp. 9]|uniref:VOC family protein n=1 Tax=Novosphingobium sp. 9 TaxID=2025349 RepID=UPI0021B5E67B|nr:VOC family protein [Novosphingobium sp. 9]
MFTHICVGSNDLARSKSFYDAIFSAAGGTATASDPASGRLMYEHKGGRLVVLTPNNGETASFANGGTIGLHMDTPEMVEAWHAAGVAAGGTTCENPPGIRSMPGRELYLAYLRDPDGNKLCGAHPVA